MKDRCRRLPPRSRRYGAAVVGRRIVLLLGMLSCAGLLGCKRKAPYYDFSFSADDGHPIVLSASFDGKGVPAGVLGGCCFSRGRATAAMMWQEYPSRGEFYWCDETTEQAYTATLHYPDDLEQIASSLDKTYKLSWTSQPEPGHAHLITSVSRHNEVVSWMANSLGGPAVVERDLREIGRAPGKLVGKCGE